MGRYKIGVSIAIFVMACNVARAATMPGEGYAPAAATMNIAMATVRSIAGSGGILATHIDQLFAVQREEARQGSGYFGGGSGGCEPACRPDYSCCATAGVANRIWASPFHTNINADSKNGQVGSGYRYTAWGVALGYDRRIGDFTFGAAFTYSRGDYDAKGVRGDDIDADNYGVSLYATYYSAYSGFFGSLYGGYNFGDNDIEMRQLGQRNSSSPHTDSYWLGGNIGYDFRLNECFTLSPSIGLLWMDSETESYRLGANRYGKIREKSLLLPIDLTASYTHRIDECTSLTFKVKGGYAYDFKNDGAEGNVFYNNTNYRIDGVKPGRHNWNVGAGIQYRRNQFDIGVDYRYDGRKRYDGHNVSATFGFRF